MPGMSAVRGSWCQGWEAEPTASSVAFPRRPAGVVKARFIGEAQGCE